MKSSGKKELFILISSFPYFSLWFQFTPIKCSPLPCPWTWFCPDTSGLHHHWSITEAINPLPWKLSRDHCKSLPHLYGWPFLLLPTSQGSVFNSLMYLLLSLRMILLKSRPLNTSRHLRISTPHLDPWPVPSIPIISSHLCLVNPSP